MKKDSKKNELFNNVVERDNKNRKKNKNR